jgi:uncharacterized delta-60 repeat protein/LPXTG-motif cell wall-anchored protein
MITIRRNHLATAFVLIAAIASIPSLASAAADGALDTTFGTGGKVTTTIGGGDQGKAIAIQSNGKILVVGDDSNDFKVVRYNTDGSLDTSFDSDGKVTTDINGGFDDGQSVAIQSDGKIVVAGMGRVGLNENFAVVRYNTDGSLDTTFDTDGKATTDIGTSTRDKANAVVIQSDGKIIAAGTSNNDFAIARYTATGALDTTFDTDGKATTDIGTSTTDTANAVAIQSDGKIIAAGTSNNDFAVARYTSTGALDTSLDTDGKATTDIGTSTSDAANAVAIQSDGKIIAAGTSNDDFAVARYTTTGALDTSLDTDGKVTTDIGTGTFDAGNAMAIQGDSKIVVAGQSSASGPPSFAVARYEVADISTSSSSSSSSTSTTVAATTTTVAAATTTTVAAAEVTTTTVAATTTTVAATTTTVAAATTTTTNAVVKRTATAASDKTSTTLPATGSNSSIPGIIGATLVVVGLVLVTRRRLVN